MESRTAGSLEVDEKLFTPIVCPTSNAPFARGYCEVQQCNPGWVRGRIHIDPIGNVVVQLGVETDHVLKQQCGSLSWNVLDAQGQSVAFGNTASECAAGKGFNGTANIKDGEPKSIKLQPSQLLKAASVKVTLKCN